MSCLAINYDGQQILFANKTPLFFYLTTEKLNSTQPKVVCCKRIALVESRGCAVKESQVSSGELIFLSELGSKSSSSAEVKLEQFYLGLNRGHVSYTILPLIG